MSKRIIYLLSLLMALSLVFAGCNKNSSITGSNDNNNNNNNGYDDSPTTESGLAEDSTWIEENSEKPIKNEEITYLKTVAGDAYFRNPVVVVMGANKSDIVVFAEKRYKTSGSANDIGLTGSSAADIVYVSSTDSGKNWNPAKIVGRDTQSTDSTNAVASPVVFKIDDKTVVVVASAGAGLSRVADSYSGRAMKSQLRYTIGTYANGTFTWNKKWSDDDMTTKVAQAVEKVSVTNDTVIYNYQQFGTFAARGFVTNNGKDLYLAITLVDQGSTANPRNVMGNVMVKGTYNGTSGVTWEVIKDTAIGFKTIRNDNRNSAYKESVAIGFESGKGVYYLATGASYYYGDVNMGEGFQSEQPTASGKVPGSEGSFSYLEVSEWYGSIAYDPTKYGQGDAAINDSMPKKQRLFGHVRGLNNTIAIYALKDDKFEQKASTKYYTVVGYPTDTTTLAKSSSMDVLGDGTIVMVAEQGGKEREYNIVFKRFTQQFLATKLGMDAAI